MARLKICSVKGCKRPFECRGFCRLHRERWRRHGNPNKVLTHFSPNKVVRRGKIVRIQLNRRDGTVLWAKVDAKDWDGLNLAQYRWYASWSAASNTFYVRTSALSSAGIHRLIFPKAIVVDHKDFNGLNNNRKNLRPATHYQSTHHRRRPRGKHSSRFKGVTRLPSGRWEAQAFANDRHYYIGSFDREIDAARAAFDKRKQLHGKFKTIGRRP